MNQKRPISILSTPEEISELAQALKGSDVIAFDTEFIRESTFYPIVEIIQVATEHECWLVDAQAFKKGYPHGPGAPADKNSDRPYHAGIQPLLEIFEDRSILKIVHAAQGDQECLYTSFGVVATPTLDTAVAASFCGYGEGIGLSKLLKAVLDVNLAKGHARSHWSERPLPPQLLEYARADVEYLVQLGRHLLTKLEQLGRKQWALDSSSKWEKKSLYETDIEGIAQKLFRGAKLDRRAYAPLYRLVEWREKRVRQLNLPRRWVADDTVLVDLVRVSPSDLQHLATFRGLNKGEIKQSGEAILQALTALPEEIESQPPKSQRAEIPTTEESQALDILRCFLGILADRHRISARNLLLNGLGPELLRTSFSTREDLVKAGLLTEVAANLIGDELICFLKGKRALSVSEGGVRVIDMGES